MQTFKYFVSFYKPYKGMFFMDLLCAAVISAVDIAFPLIFGWCTGTLFVQGPDAIYHGLTWLIPAMLAMYILKAACRYYVTCQGHIMGARMETDMRRDLFEQLQKLSFGFYDRTNTGTLTSRIVSDLFDISELAHHGPENLFISLIKILGSFTVMLCINWQLGLCLAVVTLIMLWFSAIQNKRMEETFADNRKKVAGINASVVDSLEGIRVVQSFANEPLELRKFSKANEKYLRSKEANYRAMGAYYTGNHFFQGLLYVTIVLAGGLLAASHQISVGELATFVLYVNVFVSPLEILIELTEMFQKGFSGFRRFEEIMKEIPDIQDTPDARSLQDVQGNVEFRNVSFAYEDGIPVLENISFSIPAGKNVALAGPSGSGKTTICSLIPRFYDTTGGSVLVDGKNVKDLKLHSLRDAIGVVQQDVDLFDGTIADNIRYGKWDATEEEVMAAVEKANLQDLIASLPDGLQTQVGEKGTRLSGGQKQRISIARLFLKDPKILILDEATSALDNESEAVIQRSLRDLAKGRTCLTIAHRLSTIQNADEILVVDEGGIAERGTHEELMKRNGIYARYCRIQFEGDADECRSREAMGVK
ncbi:ABC transporter ATP-binding protein [uncultured Faecalibaculum sp.]|uniref:ABC transporter ATP-binding protein n=1 Tax=uncultured Faecalibaculum sp. TaxID=1729681 RepID=UPI00262A1214|nr:ABC transporter ATP-binding protein [uncultured Faecalibaculum sp.]